MTCNNNILTLTVTLFGLMYGVIHYLGKEEEKKYKEMLIMQRKMENLTELCKEMKEEIRKMQEKEKTVQRFISLSDLAQGTRGVRGAELPDEDGVDYEECIEQYMEHCSVEQFVDIEDAENDSQRNRSNSLSSLLGSAKKMVFG